MTPQFEIGLTNDCTAVRIQGHCTRDHSPAFVEAIGSVVDSSGFRQLMVDIEWCDFLDSTFLGCLVVLFRKAKSNMYIRASDSKRKDLFSSARVDRLIPVRRPEDVDLPQHWSSIAADSASDAVTLVRQVAEAHRCLAGIQGPHSATCRTIAEQLENDLQSRSG